jgi:hypothetical protein
LILLALHLAQPAEALPAFTAESANAPVATGGLAKLVPKWGVSFSGPDATIPPGELLSLARADRPRPPFPTGPQLLLANGDRIPAKVIDADDLAVKIAPAPFEKDVGWRVPLSFIRVLWVDAPPGDTPTDPARYSWLDPNRKKDVVLLRNGDVLSGDIERFSEAGKALRWKPAGKGTEAIELTQVAAVAFNPTLVTARKPKGPFVRVVTASGARISLTAAEADGARLAGTTAFGAKIILPVAELIGLDVMQGKAVYLSDLKPKKETNEGYGSLNWPAVADRSARGNPLRLLTKLGDETFDKGLGTHPKTTLVYDLGGKFRRFEALVGFDAATGRLGAAEIRVVVDGKKQAIAGLPKVTAAGGPVAVSVDVAKAKELTLVVDFGPFGDVQADVNWVNARLVE